MTNDPSDDDRVLAALARAEAIPGTVPPGPDTLIALAESAPDITPPPDLFDRIEAALDAADSAPISTQRASEGTWKEVATGVWMKTLTRSDHGTRMFLLRCEAGSVIPGHRHDHDEHVFVLEGAFRMGQVTVNAGDSQFAPGGTDHPDIHSDDGCLLLLCG